MKCKRELPKGVSADPIEASAKKGPGDSDTRPREFWGNINADSMQKLADIKLTLPCYGCTPRMCEALTLEYTITFEADQPTPEPSASTEADDRCGKET